MTPTPKLLHSAHQHAVALVEQLHTLASLAPQEHQPLWGQYVNTVQQVAQFLQSGGVEPPALPPRLSMTVQQQRDLGRLLRDRRHAIGWSRVHLARKAHLSEATIKFIETARHAPSRASLIRLLNQTELKLSWADVPGPLNPPLTPLRAPRNRPPVPPDSAGDWVFRVPHRLDFDELGDPVFVWRLWGQGPPRGRAMDPTLAPRPGRDDALPGRPDLSIQTEWVPLRR